jgi:hypothetical protein
VTPFLPLGDGCGGVRSIESIQFGGAAGGFICACLVRPLAKNQMYETNVPTEKMFGFDKLTFPEVKQGAYLNFMIQRSGTGAGSLRSELVFANI